MGKKGGDTRNTINQLIHWSVNQSAK